MKVNIKKMKHNAVIPSYQSKGASGFDLHSTEDLCVMPGDVVLVPTGLAFGLETGYELQVRPRSGIALKTFLRVANAPGTVDSDYTGEVKVIMHNTGNSPSFIRVGDRIAQGVICPVLQVTFNEVEELGTTERGNKGFGSSGV